MGKKIFLIAILLFSAIIVQGCNENTGFRYEFENFYGEFKTDRSFENNGTELNGIGYNLLKSSIIKIYSQKSSDSFNESIIISKKNSDKDVETFAKENVDNVDISGLKMSKGKTLEVKCNGITYNFVYYQGRYNMNQYTVYLSNGFLKSGQNIYVISYATLDEKSRNDFSSSFKTIQCK